MAFMTNENKLERKNSFNIVGTLKDPKIRNGVNAKNGQEYVSVNAVIESVIGGKTNEYEVEYFANKLTKDGKESQLFVNYSKMPDMIGKKISTSGEIKENMFWSTKTNQISSSQRLSGRFVRLATDNTPDAGTFELGGFIARSISEKKNKNDEVYRYDVVIGQSNYKGDNLDRFTLSIRPEDRPILAGVEGYEIGSTVELKGQLEFTTETIVKEDTNTAFGEGITKTFTNKSHNFFITGGSNPIDGESAYDQATIKKLADAYNAKTAAKELEAKNKVGNASASTTKEASTTVNAPISKRQASLI